jgi:UDP-GlcNAc:undecaprenyl-phosphate/decaprenyl-phosphate GlcNAc-1-phosphate transferase
MLNIYQLILYFLIAFSLSLIIGYFWRKLAFSWQLLDYPGERKIHKKPIPLAGGWSIFFAFFLTLLLVNQVLISGDLNYSHWLGFFAGALVIMIGGTLDDIYNLKAKWQVIFPFLAIIFVLFGGVEISQLSQPFSEIISFENLTYLSSIIIIFWLLGMMYTTKLLDGLDGLVAGLGAIASFIIFLFTSLTAYSQPDIAIASLIFSGACLAFLIFNFSPASMFLGEGGSLLIGFVLGVLAIISGAKIAIALLIMGIPALDVLWTIIRRLKAGKNPFSFSDKKHLHHRLLDLGFSQKQTSFFYYFLALFFGSLSLILQSQGKIIALFFLIILMIIIVAYFQFKNKNHKLLVHVCCATCASYFSLKYLKNYYNLTWYFYNPNLMSQEEYDKRLTVVKQVAKKYKIKLIIEDYNPKDWQEKIKAKESSKEGGDRCYICFKDRLEKTAKFAKRHGYKYFTSSLFISPYKNEKVLEEISIFIAKKYNISYLKLNWRANDNFKKSIKFAQKNQGYLQKFCGCFFSQKK